MSQPLRRSARLAAKNAKKAGSKKDELQVISSSMSNLTLSSVTNQLKSSLSSSPTTSSDLIVRESECGTDEFHIGKYDAGIYDVSPEDLQELKRCLKKEELWAPVAKWIPDPEKIRGKRYYREKIKYRHTWLRAMMGGKELAYYGYNIPTIWLDKIDVYGRTPRKKSKHEYEIEKKKLINAFNYDMCCIMQDQFLTENVTEIALYGERQNIHKFHYVYGEFKKEHIVDRQCKLCEVVKEYPIEF